VRAVVIALNDQSEDVRFWASKVLSQIGPKAIKVLTDVLSDGTDPNLTPHIISALLSMSHPDAVPAVTKFLEDNDDYRIESVFASVPEINSKDVVSTILGLLTTPKNVLQYGFQSCLPRLSL
jgi:HEAT repeat protein